MAALTPEFAWAIVTEPLDPPPVIGDVVETFVMSPWGTPATALSTYSLLAASVLALTVSTPLILPVPLKIISPPPTVKSPETICTLPLVSIVSLRVVFWTNCKLPAALVWLFGDSYIFHKLPPFHEMPSLAPGSLILMLLTLVTLKLLISILPPIVPPASGRNLPSISTE